MSNISSNQEPIILNKGKVYWVIDALYINNIIEQISSLNSHSEKEIREKIFPYTDTPFSKFLADDNIFRVSRIKKANNLEANTNTLFSTDSAIILFIEESIFSDFLIGYDYEKLTDSMDNSLINEEYWNNHVIKYHNGDVGIVVSSGINSNFDGSGTYRID